MPSIITVTGEAPASELGIVLPHEHLLADIASVYAQKYRELATSATKKSRLGSEVEMENLWWMKDTEPGPPSLINHRLDDTHLAVEEARRFKTRGGRTIADVTSRGLGRDPEGLRQIAHHLDINIVAGSGYYVSDAHPSHMDSMTATDISEEITRDVEVGIKSNQVRSDRVDSNSARADNTGIRAGVIGEIGASHPFGEDENEVKSFRGAAFAQKDTGAPITVHPPYFYQETHDVLDVLEEAGANLENIILCHMDGTILADNAIDYHKSLADRGPYLEFDTFGRSGYFPNLGNTWPLDVTRVDHIKRLLENGYNDNILISHDITHKTHLTRYGGYGYDYIPRVVVPLMYRRGYSIEMVDQLLEINPANALAIER